MSDFSRSTLAILLVMVIMFISLSVGDSDHQDPVQDPTDTVTLSDIQHSAMMTDDKLDWGLKFSAENVTRTGMTLICTQNGGSPAGELSTGAEFALDMLKDGQWVVLDPLIPEEELAWTQEAHLISPGETVTLDVDWTNLYGELEAGSYRISKTVNDRRAPGDFDSNTYFAYFTVK